MRRIRVAGLPILAMGFLAACGGCRSGGEGDVAAPAPPPPPPPAPCEGALALDDGSFETGYGFVPSAKWGIYLQRFDVPEISGRTVDEVCVCWLKTRGDQDADFEVVFYGETDRRLASEPYAVVPGRAEDIPTSKETSGRLFPVAVDGVTLPAGPSWVGVRWDPSVENFLFVCADHGTAGAPEGEEREPVPVVFQEDRAAGWADAINAKDPIFRGHQAIGVRLTVADDASPEP